VSDGATTASSLRPAVRRRRTPDLASWLPAHWSTVLTVYLASRVFSLVLLAVVWEVGRLAGFEFRTPGAELSLLDFTTSWDADRYRTIALQGYPSVLPTDAAGNVLPNEWAFLPVFPTLCHLLMVATGMPFSGAALLLSTVSGAGAALVLYRLVADAVGHRGAVWAVLLLCFGPLGFLFSVGYAEGLMLLTLFGGVLAMQRRRYGLVLACGVVAAFTRPGALALALALAVHLVVRWRTERPAGSSAWPWRVLPRRDLVQIVTAGVAVAAAGLAWPVVAHLATGQHDAYLQTEMAWWVDYVGRPGFVPLAVVPAGRTLARHRRHRHRARADRARRRVVHAPVDAAPRPRDGRVHGELRALPRGGVPAAAEPVPAAAAAHAAARGARGVRTARGAADAARRRDRAAACGGRPALVVRRAVAGVFTCRRLPVHRDDTGAGSAGCGRAVSARPLATTITGADT
jgi:hypothetical protein